MSPTSQPGAEPGRTVYSVSRLNREVRALLERGLGVVWVEGELSNLSQPASGHWYFSLKDRDAQLRCAMFRLKNSQLGFTPSPGQHVLARGDRKSTRLNSSHANISYAVFCLKKKKNKEMNKTYMMLNIAKRQNIISYCTLRRTSAR